MTSITQGIDSLLSTVQMPAGVPVATLAIGKPGAINSALFSAHILSIKYPKIKQNLKKYRFFSFHGRNLDSFRSVKMSDPDFTF